MQTFPAVVRPIIWHAVRYWIQGEDEDFDREWQRSELAGDPLPEGISTAGRVTIAAMVGAQVAALAALVLLLMDWLSTYF